MAVGNAAVETWLVESSGGLDPPPSRLLDREDELAAIRSLLLSDEVRLLTLTGPGGVGKTRLAIETAGGLRSRFAHGVVFVDLTPAGSADTVLLVVGECLGFRNIETALLLPRLQAYLTERDMLLILDNAEHVLPAVRQLAAVLAANPRIKLLWTSREPLHLRWEQVYSVPPLPLPDPQHLLPLKELAQVPSIALFMQRARAIDPDRALTEENAHAIAELCVHLDGLPLAIELAAARTTILSPDMILERLGQRLSLLRWQAEDLPERQQTLRATIAWSHELLSPQEQTLFRRLGVFAGSFTLLAAEAIAEPVGVDAIDTLASLVDKSLVQVQARDLDAVRYVLLESVRAYALERLQEAGEVEECARIHALYYLGMVERAEPEFTGPDQRYWFIRLEWAHQNLRAALRWLLDHDEGELALRLAAALGYFWETRGYTTEGRRYLEEALEKAPAADPHLRARALSWLGILLVWMADEVETPRATLTEALELAGSIPDPVTAARSLLYLGVLTGYMTKDWEQGRRYVEEALHYWEQAGDAWGIAYTVMTFAYVELGQGHHHEAVRLLEDSLARFRAMDDDYGSGATLRLLVYAAARKGDAPGALRHAQEFCALSNKVQDRLLLYLCGTGVVWLLRDQGDPEELGRLLGVIQQLQELMGIFPGTTRHGSALLSSTSEALQVRLGRDAFEATLAQGRSLTLPQMRALIQELLDGAVQAGAPKEPAQHLTGPTLLSPREQDVLRLLAEGLSNKEIAKELIISPGTVKSYVTGVLNKLGVDTRAHAVAVGAQRGLL